MKLICFLGMTNSTLWSCQVPPVFRLFIYKNLLTSLLLRVIILPSIIMFKFSVIFCLAILGGSHSQVSIIIRFNHSPTCSGAR